MFFKNLRLYQLTSEFSLTGEELHDKLLEREFKPCGSHSPNSFGWSQPLGSDAKLLTHTANICIMICACQEQKILPASVINEYLQDKVSAIEGVEGRKIRGKEKARMKDEIIFELLPQAFSKIVKTYAYIDVKNGWLIVDSPSANRAEELICLLRESLGSFPVVPALTNRNPVEVLTKWMTGDENHEGFTIQGDCELRDYYDTEGSVIRCKGQDLSSTEVIAHISAGMTVAKLTIELNERISFNLCDDFSIKQLKFLDMVQEEVADIESDDHASRFDADFSIMSLELERLISRLFEIFGGTLNEQKE
jgi:recombination associated protein RdgC